MADLTANQVQALLRALGLNASGDDLLEVTHRLNAAQESLTKLEHPDLDTIEPLPVFWLREEE